MSVQLGVGFSGEELAPDAIVRAAALAEEVGFGTAWVSDHYHPWVNAQGESPFVWSVLGAISAVTEDLRVGTGVTCPIMRIHPAIIAQAAATTQCMFAGRFWFGVGTGEALNEHVIAQRWPETSIRLDMLEEAVSVIRGLWSGESISHYGTHFSVENARIYTLPREAPPIYVSAFGEHAAKVAARIGDGLVCTQPTHDVINAFAAAGGRGPKLAQVKVVWADSVSAAEDLAYERWPTSGLSGELSQVLPTPTHFEQAVEPLHRSDILKSFACGPDPERHLESIQPYVDAGYDEIYVTQVGPDQEGFLRFYEREVLPHFGARERASAGSGRNRS
jgi:G6PDH family F420-dependent oxidoreductase